MYHHRNLAFLRCNIESNYHQITTAVVGKQSHVELLPPSSELSLLTKLERFFQVHTSDASTSEGLGAVIVCVMGQKDDKQ